MRIFQNILINKIVNIKHLSGLFRITYYYMVGENASRVFLRDVSAPTRKPTSQGSPHLQTQFQDGSCFTLSWPFSYIYFSYFTFLSVAYRIFFQFFQWFPCHFYLVFIEQQQQQQRSGQITAVIVTCLVIQMYLIKWRDM